MFFAGNAKKIFIDYIICKGCGTVIKIKEPLYCSRCGVELPDKLKRIPGYKP